MIHPLTVMTHPLTVITHSPIVMTHPLTVITHSPIVMTHPLTVITRPVRVIHTRTPKPHMDRPNVPSDNRELNFTLMPSNSPTQLSLYLCLTPLTYSRPPLDLLAASAMPALTLTRRGRPFLCWRLKSFEDELGA